MSFFFTQNRKFQANRLNEARTQERTRRSFTNRHRAGPAPRRQCHPRKKSTYLRRRPVVARSLREKKTKREQKAKKAEGDAWWGRKGRESTGAPVMSPRKGCRRRLRAIAEVAAVGMECAHPLCPFCHFWASTLVSAVCQADVCYFSTIPPVICLYRASIIQLETSFGCIMGSAHFAPSRY